MENFKVLVEDNDTSTKVNKAFKVVQCNEKGTKPGQFITKLVREELIKDSIFGDKVKKTTYYIAGTKAVAEDTLIPESAIFPKYRVEEHPMLNPETGQEFMGKWLHLA